MENIWTQSYTEVDARLDLYSFHSISLDGEPWKRKDHILLSLPLPESFWDLRSNIFISWC
jgi:hypothetical protein